MPPVCHCETGNIQRGGIAARQEPPTQRVACGERYVTQTMPAHGSNRATSTNRRQMSEIASLLTECLKKPYDPAPRLVLADRLAEEHPESIASLALRRDGGWVINTDRLSYSVKSKATEGSILEEDVIIVFSHDTVQMPECVVCARSAIGSPRVGTWLCGFCSTYIYQGGWPDISEMRARYEEYRRLGPMARSMNMSRQPMLHASFDAISPIQLRVDAMTRYGMHRPTPPQDQTEGGDDAG